MSFEQDFLHGYEKCSKHFDLWCNKASSILGNVTQCGIMELDKTGHALIATNRADFGEPYIDKEGYLLDEYLVFTNNFQEGIEHYHTKPTYTKLHGTDDALLGENDVRHGFVFKEKISDDIQRVYFFGSDDPEINNRVSNNMMLFTKFVEMFKNDSENIVNYYRMRKFNLADKKDNYFRNIEEQTCQRTEVNYFLRRLGLLGIDNKLAKKEYRCFELLLQGKSAQQTGDILGISHRTVENHFSRILRKFKVSSKKELADKLTSNLRLINIR